MEAAGERDASEDGLEFGAPEQNKREVRWSSETEGISYFKKRRANGSREFPLRNLTYIPKLA
jgi:hypothetical protein